jgi:DNA-binding NarL/FixJ family response regulator
MVAIRSRSTSRLVPAGYLAGASCLLPGRTGELLGRLSRAERCVAELVADGLSNKEISTVLERAEPTVKHQLAAAMQKCGVESRCQLIGLLLTGRPPRRVVARQSTAPRAA